MAFMIALPNYPDGLTEGAVDALIADVDAEVAASPVPTSRLLAGTAAAVSSPYKEEAA